VIHKNMRRFFLNNLLTQLEDISKERMNRVLSLKGFILNKNGDKEFLEILIFRGFSSSTTHPTELNINNSAIPKNAYLEKAVLFLGPMDPKKNTIIRGPCEPNLFTKKKYWD
tara:strand:- start:1711 stop:2046 length:336 start_codon:yes stop_codon:yes gene_type:complete